MTETKPEHSHGEYYTAKKSRPGPTDTLPEAIERFGAENLEFRKCVKKRAVLVVEEKETHRTVWSGTEVSLDEVISLIKRHGVSKRWGNGGD